MITFCAWRHHLYTIVCTDAVLIGQNLMIIYLYFFIFNLLWSRALIFVSKVILYIRSISLIIHQWPWVKDIPIIELAFILVDCVQSSSWRRDFLKTLFLCLVSFYLNLTFVIFDWFPNWFIPLKCFCRIRSIF